LFFNSQRILSTFVYIFINGSSFFGVSRINNSTQLSASLCDSRIGESCRNSRESLEKMAPFNDYSSTDPGRTFLSICEQPHTHTHRERRNLYRTNSRLWLRLILGWNHSRCSAVMEELPRQTFWRSGVLSNLLFDFPCQQLFLANNAVQNVSQQISCSVHGNHAIHF
jgi:hypothetical protein